MTLLEATERRMGTRRLLGRRDATHRINVAFAVIDLTAPAGNRLRKSTLDLPEPLLRAPRLPRLRATETHFSAHCRTVLAICDVALDAPLLTLRHR